MQKTKQIPSGFPTFDLIAGGYPAGIPVIVRSSSREPDKLQDFMFEQAIKASVKNGKKILYIAFQATEKEITHLLYRKMGGEDIEKTIKAPFHIVFPAGDNKTRKKEVIDQVCTAAKSGTELVLVDGLDDIFMRPKESQEFITEMKSVVENSGTTVLVSDYSNIIQTSLDPDGSCMEIELNTDVFGRLQANVLIDKQRFVIESMYDGRPRSRGVFIIDAERRRQIAQEGWSPEHDSGHTEGELAMAGACYALTEDIRRLRSYPAGKDCKPVPDYWPFSPDWWKPTPENRIRELAKAGALIAAEIDRLTKA